MANHSLLTFHAFSLALSIAWIRGDDASCETGLVGDTILGIKKFGGQARLLLLFLLFSTLHNTHKMVSGEIYLEKCSASIVSDSASCQSCHWTVNLKAAGMSITWIVVIERRFCVQNNIINRKVFAIFYKFAESLFWYGVPLFFY